MRNRWRTPSRPPGTARATWLSRLGRRWPHLGVALLAAAFEFVPLITTIRIAHARSIVGPSWSAAVITGLACALAPIVVSIALVIPSLRTKRWSRTGAAAVLLTAGTMLAGVVAACVTVPVLLPRPGPPPAITSAFEIGLLALCIPLELCVSVGIIAWMVLMNSSKRRSAR